ncbi:xylulokinase [Stutzerimonas stutzeri ATCC 14405 = CCUG 16156]|uniref:xylulokinase n=1 Tax=Stutzerimonas stutzeri TaxID=316 RepID=UPI00025492D2|nr:xylulokinase [Stutzerimonas stutzeri]EHY79302.1 xylulokinase [Stutzerimonas stutzeri ATCC 14405 = CCUG 16156]QOZ95938.1 xylulokinase [Stutzerimonas stutzeri]
MFLGIDCGTQGTKALLFDAASGRVLGQGSAAHTLISGANGRREQDVTQWTTAFATATKAALTEAGVDGREVLGIGVSGQQHGLVTLDRDGRVLRPAKLWCDTESATENQRLLDWLGGEQGSLQRLGIVIAPGYTVSKLLWMKEQHPALFARIAHILLPHDYLNYWLTGRCVSEYGDASGTGYLDVRTRQWAFDILRYVDPSGRLEAALPELIEPHQPVGRLRPELAGRLGLNSQAIVASGGGDNMMGAIGTDNIRPGAITMSLGTSGTLYAFSGEPRISPQPSVATFCSSSGGWLPLICTMNLTNANAAIRDLLELDLDAFNALVAQAPIGCEGITMLPFLNGERVPALPQASASLHGLTTENLTRANLCRAVVEGVTFGLRYGLDLLRESGIRSERIQLIGGGAKNPLWRQIVADMMATPVVCTRHSEAAALGGAIQAAWCHARQHDSGASLEAICSRCVSLDEGTAVAPVTESVRAYEQAYRRYRQLVASTYGGQTPPELTPVAS